MKLPCLWLLTCAFALWTGLAPREAAAQTDPMAPMGAHHAGRG